MKMRIFDDRVCQLGEGPLWHPERKQLFWFDILGKKLLSVDATGRREWRFDEHVSAAGWIDRNRLLIASETALFRFDLETGAREIITPLEADNPETRSNDGRADPWDGFWIGTMAKDSSAYKGAIYRWYRGELRRLYAPITISNAICFAPDAPLAYYTDTRSRRVMRQVLDADTGWPVGEPEVFLDLRDEGLNPDGAVVDATGTLWLAQWGASRVAAYGPDATLMQTVAVGAVQSSCPAFGGPDLTMLYCTSAAVNLPPATLAEQPTNGMTFAIDDMPPGQAEHRVIV